MTPPPTPPPPRPGRCWTRPIWPASGPASGLTEPAARARLVPGWPGPRTAGRGPRPEPAATRTQEDTGRRGRLCGGGRIGAGPARAEPGPIPVGPGREDGWPPGVTGRPRRHRADRAAGSPAWRRQPGLLERAGQARAGPGPRSRTARDTGRRRRHPGRWPRRSMGPVRSSGPRHRAVPPGRPTPAGATAPAGAPVTARRYPAGPGRAGPGARAGIAVRGPWPQAG